MSSLHMLFSFLLAFSLGCTVSANVSCDPSTLNTTSGVYYAQENQTLFDIADVVSRGVCDIARYNRMADAIIPLTTDEEILIPPQVCKPDNSTCLIVSEPNATYANCVVGGPHTYLTLKGDTMAYIALKLNLTIDALMSTAWVPNMGSVNDTVEVGQTIKIPQCSPSQCIIRPGEFIYGTFKDLAAKLGSTPGQLMALNPTYNHTVAPQGEGPILTMIRDCTNLSKNITIIS
ncbi:hypothetical protein N7478_004145 [Penicillium angulare]|uniref:uncharacterized protein n=1 Tax=Penicillium angulare TaxID=116970 RepID=UPI002541E5D6|nr:uncharacterized protein N7478_004145 [Penicillium angulare]KAJ5278773.1 hypothetical protein N7478_004145 [Penicillium angulare]